MDAAEALLRILEAVNAEPPKVSVSVVRHARDRQSKRQVAPSDIRHCLQMAVGCTKSDSAPDRWVVKGVDLNRDELTVVVDVIKVLGRGFRCEVVTTY